VEEQIRLEGKRTLSQAIVNNKLRALQLRAVHLETDPNIVPPRRESRFSVEWVVASYGVGWKNGWK